MSFGTVLRTLLEQNEISQRKLAQDLHMGASTISSYVCDVREPDLKTVKRIAEYFSVSTDTLLESHTTPSSIESYHQISDILSHLPPEFQQLWLKQGKLLVRFWVDNNSNTKT